MVDYSFFNLMIIPLIMVFVSKAIKREHISLSTLSVFQFAIAASINIPLTRFFTLVVRVLFDYSIEANSIYYTFFSFLAASYLVIINAFLYSVQEKRIRLRVLVICGGVVETVLLAVSTMYCHQKHVDLKTQYDDTQELAGTFFENDNKQQPSDDNEILKDGKMLYVIFTIDTEDKRGSEPYLIEGDLSEYEIENCGVDYILKTFEQYDAKGVFFVNIYEHNLYEEDYMPELLRRIDHAGCEVGLHSHRPEDGEGLDFFQNFPPEYNLEDQKKIYQYGSDYIFKAIGKRPISYRAGAYRINDDSLEALKETGFLVDSSLYYGNANNKFYRWQNYHNQIINADGIYEFPVMNVFTGKKWTKLDLETLSTEELIRTFEILKESSDYNCVQIMFHSFSFIDRKGADNAPVLVTDYSKDIYGESKEEKAKFEAILKVFQENPCYEVITFEDWINLNKDIPSYTNDNFIYLDNESIAFLDEEVVCDYQNDTIRLVNNHNGYKDIQYRFVIRYEDSNEKVADSGYSSDNNCAFSLGQIEDNSYLIGAYIRNDNDDYYGKWLYRITVKDGVIEELTER